MARPTSLSKEIAFRQKVAKYENWVSRGLVDMTSVPDEVRARLESRKVNAPAFWYELLAQLDFHDVRILEYVYHVEQGATTLQQLVRGLRNVGIRREAIRCRVRMLANLGLLDLAERTKPLCISSRIELESKVTTLIRGVYQRLGVRPP